MRLRIPFVAFITFSAAIAISGLVTFAGIGNLTAPSDLLSKENPPYGMTFVFKSLDDLRRLYCDEVVIGYRQKRRVCRIDSEMIMEWRRDVPVSTNSTLADVLYSAGQTNWNPGKQIRIIKKNAILQSPFLRQLGPGPESWQQFTKTRIEPADIVVICTRD
jgi:hypothetical protein